MTNKATQVENYFKNRRTGRIYTRAVLVSKWDQDICIPKKKDSHDASSVISDKVEYKEQEINNSVPTDRSYI